MSESLTPQDDAALANFDAAFDGGSDGWEDFSQDDVITPFLNVVQALSPQAKKSSEKYIPEADEGDIFNTGSNTLVDMPVRMVPVKYTHEWAEFTPRDEGGGLVARHPYSDQTIQELIKGQEFGHFKRVPGDDSSADLIETYYVLCLVLDENNEPEYPVMLAISKLKISAWKRYLTAINGIMVPTSKGRRRPPLYMNVFELGTTVRQHPKGDSMVFSFSAAGDSFKKALLDPRSEAFQEAKNLAESFAAGEVKVNYDQSAEDTASPEATSEEEIPF